MFQNVRGLYKRSPVTAVCDSGTAGAGGSHSHLNLFSPNGWVVGSKGKGSQHKITQGRTEKAVF